MKTDGVGRVVFMPAALAAGAGLAVFVVGTGAGSAIIRAVHGNRSELEWLADAVISMAVTGLTYPGRLIAFAKRGGSTRFVPATTPSPLRATPSTNRRASRSSGSWPTARGAGRRRPG